MSQSSNLDVKIDYSCKFYSLKFLNSIALMCIEIIVTGHPRKLLILSFAGCH